LKKPITNSLKQIIENVLIEPFDILEEIKEKKVIDKIAAQIILQGYLDWKGRDLSDSDEMLD